MVIVCDFCVDNLMVAFHYLLSLVPLFCYLGYRYMIFTFVFFFDLGSSWTEFLQALSIVTETFGNKSF